MFRIEGFGGLSRLLRVWVGWVGPGWGWTGLAEPGWHVA